MLNLLSRHYRSGRNIIERVFGVSKRRFSCMHNENRMLVQNTPTLILACFVLHNIARRNNILLPEEIEEFYLRDFLLSDSDSDTSDDDNDFDARNHVVEQIFAQG